MKQLLLIAGLILSVILLNSCNEEVNLTGDFQETVVVHGLLDQADSVHYIKINRAFIGPGDATTIAQIPDSSYFTNIVATISEYFGTSTVPSRTWTLQDTLIDNKDPNGVFYAPTQKLYYFHTIGQAPLDEDAIYKLDININNGELLVHGETELVKGISSPISSQNFQFKFADNPGSYIQSSVTASNVGTSNVMNATMNINISEYIAGVPTQKTITWDLGDAQVAEGDNVSFPASGEIFFETIKNGVTDNPLIEKRRLESLTVTFTGGSQDLNNYINVNKPSSSLAQNKPTFTNLTISGSGKGRVIGIFSSRKTEVYNRPFYVDPGLAYVRCIDKKTTRELCTGPITGLLLFCSQHIADQTEIWHCI